MSGSVSLDVIIHHNICRVICNYNLYVLPSFFTTFFLTWHSFWWKFLKYPTIFPYFQSDSLHFHTLLAFIVFVFCEEGSRKSLHSGIIFDFEVCLWHRKFYFGCINGLNILETAYLFILLVRNSRTFFFEQLHKSYSIIPASYWRLEL